MNLLQNKYVWMVIIAIIILIVIRMNWYRIKRLIQKPDLSMDEGESSQIPEARKVYLRNLARRLFDDLHSSWYSSQDYKLYEEAYRTSDLELKYLSTYYRDSISRSTWLYRDIDEVAFAFSDIDVKLMSRLSKIGEKA